MAHMVVDGRNRWNCQPGSQRITSTDVTLPGSFSGMVVTFRRT